MIRSVGAFEMVRMWVEGVVYPQLVTPKSRIARFRGRPHRSRPVDEPVETVDSLDIAGIRRSVRMSFMPALASAGHWVPTTEIGHA